MSNLKLPVYHTGDWVQGNTFNDQLIQGYIYSIHPSNGTLKIHVTKSDHQQIIGKTIETFIHRIKPLMDSIDDQEAYLENLIDVALLTKDREWFMVIWEKLDALKQQKKEEHVC